MGAYDTVKKARDIQRLSTIEVINSLCTGFIELHGDRSQKDDKAIVGGIGLIDDTDS